MILVDFSIKNIKHVDYHNRSWKIETERRNHSIDQSGTQNSTIHVGLHVIENIVTITSYIDKNYLIGMVWSA